MKKLVLFLVAAGFVLSLNSCDDRRKCDDSDRCQDKFQKEQRERRW